MKGYLLDTSTCVAIFRGDRNVAAKLKPFSYQVTISPMDLSNIWANQNDSPICCIPMALRANRYIIATFFVDSAVFI